MVIAMRSEPELRLMAVMIGPGGDRLLFDEFFRFDACADETRRKGTCDRRDRTGTRGNRGRRAARCAQKRIPAANRAQGGTRAAGVSRALLFRNPAVRKTGFPFEQVTL